MSESTLLTEIRYLLKEPDFSAETVDTTGLREGPPSILA